MCVRKKFRVVGGVLLFSMHRLITLFTTHSLISAS